MNVVALWFHRAAADSPRVSRGETLGQAEIHRAMRPGLFGLGTDEDALLGTLETTPPDEMRNLALYFREHYQKELREEGLRELDGLDESRFLALLEGRSADARADALEDSLRKGEVDRLVAYLEELPEGTLEAYKQRHRAELSSRLEEELGGYDRDLAVAVLGGDPVQADAVRLRRAMKGGRLFGLGTDEETVYAVLGRRREGLEKAYGPGLREDLRAEFRGASQDRVLALVDGDLPRARAAQARGALDQLFPDQEALLELFWGLDVRQRESLEEAYEDAYGSKLAQELQGRVDEKVMQVFRQGGLSRAERLRYALEGIGTDYREVKEALACLAQDQVAKVRVEYLELTGRSLDEDLARDLSGREAFDTGLALAGEPETLEQALHRMNQVQAYEREGAANAVGSFFLDLLTDDGERLDRNVARAKELLGQAQDLRSRGRDSEAARLETALARIAHYVEADVQDYRQRKDQVANQAGNIGVGAAVAATGGLVAPVLAGAAARALASAIVGGRGYSWEHAGQDAALGAMESVVGLAAVEAAALVRHASGSGLAGDVVGRVLKAGLKKGGHWSNEEFVEFND